MNQHYKIKIKLDDKELETGSLKFKKYIYLFIY